jgi:hypothetical protein
MHSQQISSLSVPGISFNLARSFPTCCFFVIARSQKTSIMPRKRSSRILSAFSVFNLRVFFIYLLGSSISRASLQHFFHVLFSFAACVD